MAVIVGREVEGVGGSKCRAGTGRGAGRAEAALEVG